jgi:hypothetical protein
MRLDNTVYRWVWLRRATPLAKWFASPFCCQWQSVDFPSFQVKSNDVIRVRGQKPSEVMIHKSMKRVRDGKMVLGWNLDKAQMQGTVLSVPNTDIPVKVNENLIVELFKIRVFELFSSE